MFQRWNEQLHTTLKIFCRWTCNPVLTYPIAEHHLVQCAIPVFEGLLPEPHNHKVLRLLFALCHWHGLAKLQLHTDDTLDIMETMTPQLANLLWEFRSLTCSAFQMKELQREGENCMRQEAKQTSAMTSHPNSQACSSQHKKVFSLQTYKIHALADYPVQIRMYGTMDSFSTQIVCQFYRSDPSTEIFLGWARALNQQRPLHQDKSQKVFASAGCYWVSPGPHSTHLLTNYVHTSGQSNAQWHARMPSLHW